MSRTTDLTKFRLTRGMWLLAAALGLSCAENPSAEDLMQELSSMPDVAREASEAEDAERTVDLAIPETSSPETMVPEVVEKEVTGLGCDPGEGCFLDKCEGNEDCQSGWCVDHLGEGVCSRLCQEECPPGWSCQQVAGTEPDVIYVCVSDYTNLCRPCSDGNDCKSDVGSEDVCVDYQESGSFCGGACVETDDCPWGFSCQDVETVDGIITTQCVTESGGCPCTAKSVALSLWTPCYLENEWGLCEGKRVCTTDGLTACDAQVPQQETCNGIDDECDGETDEPIVAEGNYVNPCDDGNPCTDDACKGVDGCDYEILDSGECMDGDPCTVADHCEDGICVGKPVDCDDQNPCTDDICTADGGCEAIPAQGECDDGNPCTLGDHCVDGSCAGAVLPCDCQADEDCAALDDGNKCNGELICDSSALPYLCVVDQESVVACPEPDGVDSLCLEPHCDPSTGSCSFVPAHEGNPCDNNDKCTFGDSCENGLCVPGQELNCNDANPCTTDSCTPATGCQNEDNLEPCDDGNPCTIGDTCDDGTCQPGLPLDCDDNNSCTDDSCDSGLGCKHEPNTTQCDDGNACTTGDQCAEGVCAFAEVISCADNNPCTADSCDAQTGCINEPVAGACTNGDPCTVGDTCLNGLCQGGAPLDCDDGNECTTDSCGNGGACVNEPVAGVCDDGDKCTTGDHCEAGACVADGALDCLDDNPCTDEHCDPALGCVSTLNQAPCDDDDLCTTGDHCQLGLCVSSGQLACVDGNPCTDDSCSPGIGCEFTPNDAQCDDGNECTEQDGCSDGQCLGQGYPDCDDLDECTADVCDPATGCVHLSLSGVVCEDGNLCTVGDQCEEGVCEPGSEPSCDDGDVCTQDQCDPDNGCANVALSDTPCDDGNSCTEDDFCLNGQCQSGETMDCDDEKPCTDDVCIPGVGCIHTNNSESCNDGNLCTTGDFCAGGLCQPGPDEYPCDDSNACTVGSCDAAANECKYDNVADYTACENGAKWCKDGACVQKSGGTFCFTGPEKATMSGNQICNEIFGLPCGPGATKTFHADNCQGTKIDSGRGCHEMPLDPYNAGSALLICGGP